ncbi:MAG: MarR family transcriptional regulator [Solirubrobacterales bacterium]|jgi:DNA-binding MarR family transcriptional regulator|nr:MarR family transcriptional regulator [Solirubrobacterales bacterium]
MPTDEPSTDSIASREATDAGAATAELAHELRETVGRLVRRVRLEPGPPVPRMIVLGRLDRGGPASTSDLAAAERMRPQSMAQTVRDLEQAGLVSRRPDPDDGRRAFVELTVEGRELLRATRAQRETWLGEALDRELSARERRLLREALVLLGRVADS